MPPQYIHFHILLFLAPKKNANNFYYQNSLKSFSSSYTIISLVPGDSRFIVCWPCWTVSLFVQELFVFRMLTMTCQSLLLIRGLNELCLPSSTLKSDFPAPQAFTVDLAACKAHCAALLLRLFSSKEGWRQTILKKKKTEHGLKKVCSLPLSFFFL